MKFNDVLFDPDKQIVAIGREQSIITTSIQIPIFDVGPLELLNFDSESGIKLRDDPVFDKKTGIVDQEALDTSYEVRLTNKTNNGQLFVYVPIKHSFQPSCYSINSLKFYKVEDLRLRSGKIGSKMTEYLSSLGINNDLHKLLLEVAREHEKRLYRQWLTQMSSYFGEDKGND